VNLIFSARLVAIMYLSFSTITGCLTFSLSISSFVQVNNFTFSPGSVSTSAEISPPPKKLISPNHIDIVKELLPNINVSQGDAENLEFEDNFFDLVFCFRSTWYFPDVIKSISEMLRVVKNDGLVMFDIQNINHPIHQKTVMRWERRQKNHPLINIIEKYIKNIIKILIRPIVFHAVEWSFQSYPFIETPTDPNDVFTFLQDKDDIVYKLYGVEWDNPFTLKEIKKIKNLDQFDRLVYKISKYQ